MAQYKRMQFRKWFVVINNPEDDTEDRMKALVDGEVFRAVWGQRERGTECGTEHLQVQIYGKKMTYSKIIKIIHGEFGKGHIEHVRNEKACDVYTVKMNTCIEGSKFEYGDIPSQGKRSDLEELRRMIHNKASIEEIKEKDFGLYARYKNVLKEEIKEVRQKSIKEEILEEFSNVQWKEWQKEIVGRSQERPDNRKVHWYWDSKGNVGKSFLSRFLCAKYDVYYVTGGKSQDILYGYNNQSIIVYDLPRVCEEHMQAVYQTIECFKNGMFLSTKYESQQRIFRVPHIFVFANYSPDEYMLSKDRWDIKEIKNESESTNVGRSTTYGNNSSPSAEEEDVKEFSEMYSDTEFSSEIENEYIPSLFRAYDGVKRIPSMREAKESSNKSIQKWRKERKGQKMQAEVNV